MKLRVPAKKKQPQRFLRMSLPVLILTISMMKTYGQDTLNISLSDAITATLKNNRELTIARLDQEGAAARFKQTNAVFLPDLKLSYTSAITNNPLNAFGFKLQQQTVSMNDFNPLLMNNPEVIENYTAQIQLNQPLLNLDMVLQRRAAKQEVEMHQFKRERVKEYLTLEVERSYGQLQLAHAAKNAQEQAVITVQSILSKVRNYYSAGYLQRSDLLLAEVEMAAANRKLADATSSVRNASDYLNLLMGVSFGAIYIPEPLESPAPIDLSSLIVDNTRADFQVLEAAIKAQALAISSEKKSLLPRLNAFGSYSINDKEALGFGSTSYLFGAQLSWTLFDGTKSYYRINEMRIARTKTEQQLLYQKELADLELSKAVRQYRDALSAVQNYEASVLQASEALRLQQNRFEKGLLAVDDVLKAQASVSVQTILRVEALCNLNTTIAYLRFLTSVSGNKN